MKDNMHNKFASRFPDTPEAVLKAAVADANAAAYVICNGEKGSVPGRYQKDIEENLVACFVDARMDAKRIKEGG